MANFCSSACRRRSSTPASSWTNFLVETRHLLNACIYVLVNPRWLRRCIYVHQGRKDRSCEPIKRQRRPRNNGSIIVLNFFPTSLQRVLDQLFDMEKSQRVSRSRPADANSESHIESEGDTTRGILLRSQKEVILQRTSES